MIASPMSLREWTRKGDMRTWEALERQALAAAAEKAREPDHPPTEFDKILARAAAKKARQQAGVQ